MNRTSAESRRLRGTIQWGSRIVLTPAAAKKMGSAHYDVAMADSFTHYYSCVDSDGLRCRVHLSMASVQDVLPPTEERKMEALKKFFRKAEDGLYRSPLCVYP